MNDPVVASSLQCFGDLTAEADGLPPGEPPAPDGPSWARNTRPMPPSPRKDVISYEPSRVPGWIVMLRRF